MHLNGLRYVDTPRFGLTNLSGVSGICLLLGLLLLSIGLGMSTMTG